MKRTLFDISEDLEKLSELLDVVEDDQQQEVIEQWFEHQVFIDEKPAYYSFANETKNMTGAELFAQFAPPKSK